MSDGVPVIEITGPASYSRGTRTHQLDLALDGGLRLLLSASIGEAHLVRADASLHTPGRREFIAVAWTGGAGEPAHLHVSADRGSEHLTLWVGSAGFNLPRSEADKVELFLLEIGAAIPVIPA